MDQCSLVDRPQHVNKMELPATQDLICDAGQSRWREERTGVVAPVGRH